MAHIRRTTARLAVSGAAVVAATALAGGAALAQYPPPPPEVTVTTPGATIQIAGQDWGPDTVVTITYNGTQAQRNSTQATVAEDGTFVAEVTVPADAVDSASWEIAGVDAAGEPRTETRSVDVALAGTPIVPDLAPPAEDDGGMPVGLLAVTAGAVALGGVVTARRRAGAR